MRVFTIQFPIPERTFDKIVSAGEKQSGKKVFLMDQNITDLTLLIDGKEVKPCHIKIEPGRVSREEIATVRKNLLGKLKA